MVSRYHGFPVTNGQVMGRGAQRRECDYQQPRDNYGDQWGSLCQVYRCPSWCRTPEINVILVVNHTLIKMKDAKSDQVTWCHTVSPLRGGRWPPDPTLLVCP